MHLNDIQINDNHMDRNNIRNYKYLYIICRFPNLSYHDSTVFYQTVILLICIHSTSRVLQRYIK